MISEYKTRFLFANYQSSVHAEQNRQNGLTTVMDNGVGLSQETLFEFQELVIFLKNQYPDFRKVITQPEKPAFTRPAINPNQ